VNICGYILELIVD